MDVRVTIPFSTLFGIDEQPGHLAGYGPITADQARELAASGTWRRILTDPATGNPVDFDTTRYRPPAALRDAIITKHPTCQRPGCTMPAVACDVDITNPGTAPATPPSTTPAPTATPSGHTYQCKPEPVAEPVQPPPPSHDADEPPF